MRSPAEQSPGSISTHSINKIVGNWRRGTEQENWLKANRNYFVISDKIYIFILYVTVLLLFIGRFVLCSKANLLIVFLYTIVVCLTASFMIHAISIANFCCFLKHLNSISSKSKRSKKFNEFVMLLVDYLAEWFFSLSAIHETEECCQFHNQMKKDIE